MKIFDLTRESPVPLAQPESLSAARLLSYPQALLLLALIAYIVSLVLERFFWQLGPSLYSDVQVGFDILLLLTASTVLFKVTGFLYSFSAGEIVIPDDHARREPNGGFPRAVLLVPTYGEPHMIPRIVRATRSLKYPPGQLLILFATEWKDYATHDAIIAEKLPDQFGMVICPKRDKPGKPDACNFALQVAVEDGWCDEYSIAGIFDIEDIPEPHQVARAAWALHDLPQRVGAVQARLNFTDPLGLNWLGRHDQAAYDWNFTLWNRGLSHMGGPFPLGGTSQWFRMKVLYNILQGWDPDNLTEDADIGIKLARNGFEVRTFNSHTNELANRQLRNWIGRDARWWAGFVQTYLVHMRSPWKLLRELGLRRFMSFQLNFGFMTFTQVVNPLFWILTLVYIVGRMDHLSQVTTYIEGLFPPPIYLAGITAFTLGNALMVFFLIAAAHETKHYRGLVIVVLTSPAYWALLFVAAIRGIPMLVTKKWFRTGHGGGEANAADKLPDIQFEPEAQYAMFSAGKLD